MKNYINILFDPPNRKITLFLLIFGSLFVAVGSIIGIADNPPGIIVMFVGIILLFFAFIHFWRKEKSFLILIGVSLFGGFVFAVLHNFLDALVEKSEGVFLVPQFLEALSAGSFLIAVLICPVGIFVGFFGALLTYFLKRNPKQGQSGNL